MCIAVDSVFSSVVLDLIPALLIIIPVALDLIPALLVIISVALDLIPVKWIPGVFNMKWENISSL